MSFQAAISAQYYYTISTLWLGKMYPVICLPDFYVTFINMQHIKINIYLMCQCSSTDLHQAQLGRFYSGLAHSGMWSWLLQTALRGSCQHRFTWLSALFLLLGMLGQWQPKNVSRVLQTTCHASTYIMNDDIFLAQDEYDQNQV